MKYKQVPLNQFETFETEYSADDWKVYGYSEYNSSGIPRYADLCKE